MLFYWLLLTDFCIQKLLQVSINGFMNTFCAPNSRTVTIAKISLLTFKAVLIQQISINANEELKVCSENSSASDLSCYFLKIIFFVITQLRFLFVKYALLCFSSDSSCSPLI